MSKGPRSWVKKWMVFGVDLCGEWRKLGRVQVPFCGHDRRTKNDMMVLGNFIISILLIFV